MANAAREEPSVYGVVATNWGYPDQEIWVQEWTGSWTSNRGGGYLTWEELLERGEVAFLVPEDRDRSEAGRREGRFEILRALDGAMRQLSDATYKIPGDR